MENNDLEFIKEIKGYKIFCHFTDRDPRLIINRDLGLNQPEWYTTMTELTEEDIENLESFLADNFKDRIGNFRHSAIIIAVPAELGYNFIIKNDNIRVKNVDYILDNQFILCSVDNIRQEILFNDYAIAREENFCR